MKKIAFVGANDLMVPYINELATTHQVTVFDSGTFTVPLAPAVMCIPLPKTLWGLEHTTSGERSLPYAMRGLRQALGVLKPDTIIVLDFIRVWYWQVLLYRLVQTKTHVFVYSETQRVPRSGLSALAFCFFFGIFAVTQKLLTGYLAFTDLGRDFAKRFWVMVPVTVVPPPVDTTLFTPKPIAPTVSPVPLRLLMNARFVAYKRHSDVLKALVAIKAAGVPVRLTCIGRDTTLRPLFELEAKALGVADRIVYQEALPRAMMTALYQAHDVLLLPSDNEAIGMVVPEAMASGLATITSDTVGANVYVVPGKTGYIFKTGDTKALADCIIQLAGPGQAAACGEAAAAAMATFTVAHLAGRFRACTLVDTKQ